MNIAAAAKIVTLSIYFELTNIVTNGVIPAFNDVEKVMDHSWTLTLVDVDIHLLICPERVS